MVDKHNFSESANTGKSRNDTHKQVRQKPGSSKRRIKHRQADRQADRQTDRDRQRQVGR